MLACPSKKFLHVDCPGCGLQRSVLYLLKGDLTQSLEMYPATIPIILTICFLILHLRFKFSAGATVLKYSHIFCAIIIMSSYIFKTINNFKPFN